MKTDTSLWRAFGARAPLLASMVGMSLVLTSVVIFFVEDDSRRIMGVTAGLFCLLLAIWYAAHPFLKEERTHPELRREVGKFVDLARDLHYAAIRGDTDAFESIRERVPAQVEIVIDTARESGSSPSARVGE